HAPDADGDAGVPEGVGDGSWVGLDAVVPDDDAGVVVQDCLGASLVHELCPDLRFRGGAVPVPFSWFQGGGGEGVSDAAFEFVEVGHSGGVHVSSGFGGVTGGHGDYGGDHDGFVEGGPAFAGAVGVVADGAVGHFADRFAPGFEPV